jgi:hypothetical protein
MQLHSNALRRMATLWRARIKGAESFGVDGGSR